MADQKTIYSSYSRLRIESCLDNHILEREKECGPIYVLAEHLTIKDEERTKTFVEQFIQRIEQKEYPNYQGESKMAKMLALTIEHRNYQKVMDVMFPKLIHNLLDNYCSSSCEKCEALERIQNILFVKYGLLEDSVIQTNKHFSNTQMFKLL